MSHLTSHMNFLNQIILLSLLKCPLNLFSFLSPLPSYHHLLHKLLSQPPKMSPYFPFVSLSAFSTCGQTILSIIFIQLYLNLILFLSEFYLLFLQLLYILIQVFGNLSHFHYLGLNTSWFVIITKKELIEYVPVGIHLGLPVGAVSRSVGPDLNLYLRGFSLTTLRTTSIFLSLVNLIFLSYVYKDIQQ